METLLLLRPWQLTLWIVAPKLARVDKQSTSTLRLYVCPVTRYALGGRGRISRGFLTRQVFITCSMPLGDSVLLGHVILFLFTTDLLFEASRLCYHSVKIFHLVENKTKQWNP